MDQTAILQPVVAMLLLTLAVWVYMFVRRFGFFLPNKIDAERLKTPEEAKAIIPETVNNIGNNFSNLFEMPVVFYAICLVLFATGSVDKVYINAAWVFVFFRLLHSLIQCSYNRVMHRFSVYAISSIAAWFMVIRFAADIF